LKKNPGKTLIIGAGYIALECASFLHHIGNDVTVMIRSRPLRTMDNQCGEMICELMERDGVKFIMPANPRSFSALEKPSKLENAKEHRPGVWEHGKDAKGNIYMNQELLKYNIRMEKYHGFNQKEKLMLNTNMLINEKEKYIQKVLRQVMIILNKWNRYIIFVDLVLLAIGRTANIAGLGLDKIGVHVVNGKVLVDEREQTNLSHIYALGDVATGKEKTFIFFKIFSLKTLTGLN
jgi:pyruvate/2-oxoglutarate dehydrogenase complex dihydrolipoamide dehydrogenase (E3) component